MAQTLIIEASTGREFLWIDCQHQANFALESRRRVKILSSDDVESDKLREMLLALFLSLDTECIHFVPAGFCSDQL